MYRSTHTWAPCSQMKDYESFPPVKIKKAYGSYIELENGKKLIDATSSWWCKSLGHQHPRLKEALLKQVEKFEHIMMVNTTHDTIETLSENLAGLSPHLNKVFYASEGSSAIEIALKMSLHSRLIQGNPERTCFIALKNAYHGETTGALSVSDIGLYRTPYKPLLFDSKFIQNIPYVNSTYDPLWSDASSVWPQIETALEPYKENATALILEPIIQGAGGMKLYSQDFLKRLRQWTQENHIHLIADEIMTGFGRTGKMLACEHAHIEPDFLCLGKGLTSGWLPMSAVLTHQAMYDYFYHDDRESKAFLHSHTHSGNALAASVALATLQVFKEENTCAQSTLLGKKMLSNMHDIAKKTGRLENVRGIGAIVAADLITNNPKDAFGEQVFKKAVELGALLRPLGNTLYWLPPLNTKTETLEALKIMTLESIENAVLF